jgi:hypothetical protein
MMTLKKLALAMLLTAAVACGDGTLDVVAQVDSGAPDTEVTATDNDAPCTQWGCVYGCLDGGCGCMERICISHDPSVCPGPWPCK